MVSADEERLWIQRSKNGDTAAYGLLVDHYWPRVQRWVQSVTQDSQVAEDLTRQTFLKVWSSLPFFVARSGRSFPTWLFRIARRCLVDSNRYRRSPHPSWLPEADPAETPGPICTLVAGATLTLSQQAISHLPGLLREVFLLRTQEGLPYAEIAIVTGLNHETVRRHICKARKALLHELEPNCS
jgi:RNA polymerase sigma-70 factor (ECF subfamily)